MDIFNEEASNSLDHICEKENNKIFGVIVSLVSMLNKRFYSPVAFIIEYYTNKELQKLLKDMTGLGYGEFFVLFFHNFPTVVKSRKLKKIILNDEQDT
jgi:hypothetical protein